MMGSMSKSMGVGALCAVLAGAWLGCADRSAPAASAAPVASVSAGSVATATRQLTAEEAGEYLRAAARNGDVEVAEGLLKAGAPVDAVDDNGYTPLILAAYHGELPVVEVLLSRGADACRGDRRGNTALMGAAFKGYEAVVERLSRERCAVGQTNGAGRTALMFAMLVGKTGITRLLRSRGADPAARDATGRTAEDWAKTQGMDLREGPPAAASR